MAGNSKASVQKIPFNHRAFFLSVLGVIQLIAFWSYFVQFPGLLSSSGIEPVQRVFPHAAPWLYQRYIASGFIDEDSLCELLALMGMFFAAILASGGCQHGALLAANGAIYGILVRTGGVFYHFQWDTLLLETTAVACLAYAPWTGLRPTHESASPVAPIPLRFLLFKLMYMSGVVKLQARCPTWENLTALEYHFATQCLPGPLAWHAHQLPPILLRLGVALTLWIEIPAAVLLVLPMKRVRRFGAVLQVALQVMIILTGNYNFFNLLTMALCIPVWETHLGTDIPIRPMLQNAFLTLFALSSASSMFQVQRAWQDHHWNIVLSKESTWIQPDMLLPYVPYFTMALVAATSVVSALRSRSLTKIFHSIVCLLVIGMVAVPLSQIFPNERVIQTSFGPVVQQFARPYLLVNGYGLFRRMTGVGQVPSNVRTGWAGLPPSVVARPEIVLEGVYNVTGDSSEEAWEELVLFRWKPGIVSDMPWQVAPHQPRLDWQMWFAALGSINHNPWLVSLLQKLLHGCDQVQDLVGLDTKSRQRKLLRIRAKLFHYDFTRMNTTWSRTIPEVDIVDGVSSFPFIPSRVWSRKIAREYLPPVTEEDLSSYLLTQGFSILCRDTVNYCDHVKSEQFWCLAVHTIRTYRLHLIFPLSVITWFLYRVFHQKQLPRDWVKQGSVAKTKND